MENTAKKGFSGDILKKNTRQLHSLSYSLLSAME